ncbi:peroxiredoxin [Chitinophaga terrae (ex Kim and Jung 2007)]|uniref:TlpA disulfide reductase family protein n=1 Tax=Chitinophaga terrae (ex Kim and Jung 2007) TaxID=408074 RepID=UPI00278AA82F|nr:TlpA disulfide reductase family protein [Chitinophaga terrae (ex Kim and Jung 2007)]MDQ0108771.1 peroxiredoxin [Chitinophaga terrae (ex Kim and Jung 2007)]
MNKLMLVTLLSWPMLSSAQEGRFVINGRMEKIDVPTKIYLTTVVDDIMTMDSATIQNNQFHFEGKVEGPIKASLFINDIRPADKAPITVQYKNNMRIFVLEPGEIKVNGKELLKTATVSSPINNLEKEYKELLRDITKTMDKVEYQLAALRANNGKPNPEKEQELAMRHQLSYGARKMLQQKYINEHPKSFFSLLALEEVAGYTYDPVYIYSMFERLDSSVINTPEGKLFKAELDRGMNLLIGSEAPDFKVTDLRTGKEVKLSDFKGKYVLVDFWATYNEYSRNAHQVMTDVYKEFADSNFTIISVTVDAPSNRDAIMEAIEKDKMEWTNLGDSLRQRNDAAKLFNIFTLPQIYLIDNNGHIFNKNFPIENLRTEIIKMRHPKRETEDSALQSAN